MFFIVLVVFFGDFIMLSLIKLLNLYCFFMMMKNLVSRFCIRCWVLKFSVVLSIVVGFINVLIGIGNILMILYIMMI